MLPSSRSTVYFEQSYCNNVAGPFSLLAGEGCVVEAAAVDWGAPHTHSFFFRFLASKTCKWECYLIWWVIMVCLIPQRSEVKYSVE